MMKYAAYITGIGAYLPERVIGNKELSFMTGLSPGEIERRTGIMERRWAAEEEAPSDLATKASIKAMKMAGVRPEEIDLIILSTSSEDMFMPSTACIVQKNIGATRAASFDVNASCSGFLYALHIGEVFIRNGQAGTILVLASEVKSRFVDPRDKDTSLLFGDGAGAIVMRRGLPGTAGRNNIGRIMGTYLHTYGKEWKLIHLPAGGSRIPISFSTINNGLHTMQMDGKKLYRFAIRTMETMIIDALKRWGKKVEDIDFFIFHQANLRLLKQIMNRIQIPPDKVPASLPFYGNTSSASIPVTLHLLVKEGKIRKGITTLLASFGGGLTWGSSLIIWE